MKRTESKIIQVAPSAEQWVIDVMSKFGWSLQGRQEMHIEKDSKGGPTLATDFGLANEYVIKTKIEHYVKLHFTRPLSFKNSDKLNHLKINISQWSFSKDQSSELR